MKKISLVLATTILSFLSFVDTTKAQEKKVQWPEWKAFHTVMAATFHPSEEGNFEPIRKQSRELVAKAEEWLKSTPPKEFDKPEIKVLLTKLRDESVAVNNMVIAKASDKELGKALAELHERFHSVVGACTNEGGEHHEHHEEKK